MFTPEHSDESARCRRCRRPIAMGVGACVQCRTHLQDNVRAVCFKGVGLGLVQFHDKARHRGTHLVQRIAHHAHAVEINRDALLLTKSGVGEFQHQAVGMDRRDHRRFDYSIQSDLDAYIFSGVRDLHVLQAGGPCALRSRKRHQ